MDYLTALDAIIDRGIAAARRDYAERPEKRDGAVAGFEACRGKSPDELRDLLRQAQADKIELMRSMGHSPPDEMSKKYKRMQCYVAEIEWTCNCVSVILVNQGQLPIVPPTARAGLAVARIVGVREPN